MKTLNLKNGTKIEYGDEVFNEFTAEWERFPNHMIGLPTCNVHARRPVAETFRIIDFQKAKEGDRIGPFSCNVEASRFAFQIAKTHATHLEWESGAIYLVVNRKYERSE